MEPIDRARAYFAKDQFAMGCTGIEIDAVETGYARCSLKVTPAHYNSEGIVMGGVLFTLADVAFAAAANLDQPKTVTLSSQITFLSAAKGAMLIADARCLHQGRTVCHYQVSISDENGSLVASASISGFIKG